MRSVLPGPRSRRTLHRARVDRLLGVLGRNPSAVRLDSPATEAPGKAWWSAPSSRGTRSGGATSSWSASCSPATPTSRALRRPLSTGCTSCCNQASPSVAGGAWSRSSPMAGSSASSQARWPPGRSAVMPTGPCRRQVRRAAAALRFNDPTLWVNDPHYAGLAADPYWPALYDITDDWAQAASGTRHRAGRPLRGCAVRRIAARSSSAPMAWPTPGGRSGRISLIPNAVDVEHLPGLGRVRAICRGAGGGLRRHAARGSARCRAGRRARRGAPRR